MQRQLVKGGRAINSLVKSASSSSVAKEKLRAEMSKRAASYGKFLNKEAALVRNSAPKVVPKLTPLSPRRKLMRDLASRTEAIRNASPVRNSAPLKGGIM